MLSVNFPVLVLSIFSKEPVMHTSKTTNFVLASLLGLGLTSYASFAHATSKTAENAEQNIQSAESESMPGNEQMQQHQQKMQEHQKNMQPAHPSGQQNPSH
jgi:hypothetical protein